MSVGISGNRKEVPATSLEHNANLLSSEAKFLYILPAHTYLAEGQQAYLGGIRGMK